MDNLTELTFTTVPKLWKQRGEIFKNSVFDMQNIRKIDAAGAAYLVQWAKSLDNKKIKLLNVSQTAVNLITTYRLNEILEIEN